MSKSKYPRFRVLILPLLTLVVLCFIFAAPARDFLNKKSAVAAPVVKDSVSYTTSARASNIAKFSALYEKMKLDSMGLTQAAFNYGLQGYIDLLSTGAIKNSQILSIVDFSLPSSQKRLFVINLMTGKLIFNTLVSHGRNSGKEMATEFSNDLNSFKSSLGFFVTGNTYKGEHGYSLRLEGQEVGINDNAYNRSIVMHAANYVNDNLIKAQGFLGRSLGCPAVPPALHKSIINAIKGGSCLFLYSPDKTYITRSKMISQPVLQDTATG